VNDSTARTYRERFGKVIDYIDQHLDGDLSVERLSQVASFSKFHFHRVFSSHTGINVYRYVQLMRLKRASYQLVFGGDARIIDIALDAGFENPESFSRAFKRIFDQTPSQFRKSPAWKPWWAQLQTVTPERLQNMNVTIVDFEETKIAALEHRGDPELINDSVKRFIEWRKQSGLSPVHTSKSFGIAYDNPQTTEPDEFRFDLCGSVNEAVLDNSFGIVNRTIPAGRCARVRHLGSHQGIGASAVYLYRDWLPESGEALRDFPLFFHYLNLIPDVEEHELITDLYLPLL
jgi:AraC family transcriptional regulator